MYEYMDPELGIVLETREAPFDVYQFYPIDDNANGIRFI